MLPRLKRAGRHDLEPGEALARCKQLHHFTTTKILIGVDLRSMLPRVRSPTLLIWGGRDTLVSAVGREALRTGIVGAEVRNFDSLGHDLFWEDPRAVAPVMIYFLTKK